MKNTDFGKTWALKGTVVKCESLWIEDLQSFKCQILSKFEEKNIVYNFIFDKQGLFLFSCFKDDDNVSPKDGGENIRDDVASRTESSQDLVNPVSPLTPSDVDWDALYEEDAEEDEVDMKSHGSVITHLLSQVGTSFSNRGG